MSGDTPLDRWMSVEEIAAYLGISKETVYRWVQSKKIPAHRIGKFWKFKPAEVDDWVTSGGAGELSKKQDATNVGRDDHEDC